MSSSPTAEPPTKKQSEYAQLSEISDLYDPDTSIGSFHSTTSNSQQQQHYQPSQSQQFPSASETCDDDAVSVAGTVFNEPWDSNAWENLLDLAKYGDEKSNIRALAHNFYHNSTATIEEEDSLPLEVDDVVISCVDSDSDEHPLASPESVEIIQMEESADSLASLKSSNKKDVFSVENNRIWAEFSNRIPSEPSSKASTFDPRKIRSNSMMNVAGAGGAATLTRRALTPNNSSTSSSSAQMSPSQQRLRSASARPPISDPGTRIQQYVESLAKDSKTVFGATLGRFIECTIEADEPELNAQIRNVRQFLNGIKNYLVKHGEADLHPMIEAESGNLNANEFLNIDAILEAVLHKILLGPVKNHLYHLMVKEYSRNGSLQSLSENLLKVRSMKPSELGFPEGTVFPDFKEMESIKQCLRRMQNHYSPLKKLENLLRALTIVILPNRNFNNNNIEYSSKKCNLIQNGTLSGVLGSKKLPPAEELIRWLVYILARTSTINCEIEARYMWDLLPQQLLTTGDAAYYLTTLFSAVHVLKNPESIRRLGKGFPLSSDRYPDNSYDAFLSVAIPDEQSGSIEYHTFPAVPEMNAAKLCRVIAHQFAITNCEDYGLYVLFDGFETCLVAKESPDEIRNQLYEAGKPHIFAYKRHEAKIAWPKHVINTSTSSSISTCSSNISPNGSDVAAFHLRPSHVIQPSPIHKRKHLPVSSKIV
uniref:VPS9 domain-containing protein n=2 Tax=Panagrolaimus superbus TaxID=310955 RepID=A0A914Z4A3_9BILA